MDSIVEMVRAHWGFTRGLVYLLSAGVEVEDVAPIQADSICPAD